MPLLLRIHFEGIIPIEPFYPDLPGARDPGKPNEQADRHPADDAECLETG
jgi:hypothetical protein